MCALGIPALQSPAWATHGDPYETMSGYDLWFYPVLTEILESEAEERRQD